MANVDILLLLSQQYFSFVIVATVVVPIDLASTITTTTTSFPVVKCYSYVLLLFLLVQLLWWLVLSLRSGFPCAFAEVVLHAGQGVRKEASERRARLEAFSSLFFVAFGGPKP